MAPSPKRLARHSWFMIHVVCLLMRVIVVPFVPLLPRNQKDSTFSLLFGQPPLLVRLKHDGDPRGVVVPCGISVQDKGVVSNSVLASFSVHGRDFNAETRTKLRVPLR